MSKTEREALWKAITHASCGIFSYHRPQTQYFVNVSSLLEYCLQKNFFKLNFFWGGGERGDKRKELKSKRTERVKLLTSFVQSPNSSSKRQPLPVPHLTSLF